MSRLVDGWTFVSSAADGVPAIWGEGDAVLWAQGEPLMLVGPDGVGKTSLAQQLVRARLGLGRRTLLGLPVARTDGRVLYVAADRPPQAARSMKRMYQQGDEEVLRDRLVVHRGPLDFDIVSKPFLLREYVQNIEGVNTVVLDSVKDIAVKLSEDGVGGAVNIALQELVANDIDVLALHHQRKQQQNGGQPKALADVYGSRWLTAGMGSVAMLWGDPGDLVVDLRHLKQPAEEVGPFKVLHDHVRGRTTIHENLDLEQMLDGAPAGLTVKDAARLLFEKAEPKPNDIEKARRKLEGLVARGRAERDPSMNGVVHYLARRPT
jgi:replicative DNA helicase